MFACMYCEFSVFPLVFAEYWFMLSAILSSSLTSRSGFPTRCNLIAGLVIPLMNIRLFSCSVKD